VLIAGWAGNEAMRGVLAELDAGAAALPPGSEAVFVNDHARSATLGQVVLSVGLRRIKVSHVRMDPLVAANVARLDLSSFKVCVCLLACLLASLFVC
jgi:hypothetical protein